MWFLLVWGPGWFCAKVWEAEQPTCSQSFSSSLGGTGDAGAFTLGQVWTMSGVPEDPHRVTKAHTHFFGG